MLSINTSATFTQCMSSLKEACKGQHCNNVLAALLILCSSSLICHSRQDHSHKIGRVETDTLHLSKTGQPHQIMMTSSRRSWRDLIHRSITLCRTTSSTNSNTVQKDHSCQSQLLSNVHNWAKFLDKNGSAHIQSSLNSLKHFTVSHITVYC